MPKEKTANEILNDLKSLKFGFLKISQALAANSKTVKDAGKVLSLLDYEKKLAAGVESLKNDIEHAGVMTDAAFKCKVGESFKVPQMQLKMIKEGLHKLTDATEKDKAAIIAGNGKVLTLFQYSSEFVKRVDDIERSLRLETDDIKNKINHGINGAGLGPFHIAKM